MNHLEGSYTGKTGLCIEKKYTEIEPLVLPHFSKY